MVSVNADKSKLERAKRILAVRSDDEAVSLALDVVITEEEIIDVNRRIKGNGKSKDRF